MTEPIFASAISLIARPEDHDGKRIKVIGFCVIKFEGCALYLSEADYRSSITKNGLWLEVALKEENLKLSGRVLLVEGTFDAKNMGHLGMYSGRITDVARLQKWGDSGP